MGNAYLKFTVWVSTGAGLSYLAAPNFLDLLGQSLDDTFGSVFPAIPFVALLTMLFAMRWGQLKDILVKDDDLRSEPVARGLGVAAVATVLLLRGFTGQSVELSGVAIITTFYGASLALIPAAKRLILPYALTYSAGVTAPSAIQLAFGEPLASVSTSLSAWVVSLTGLPITWHGTEFSLISKTGEVVSATVTPGCSSIISVTTFLGLLALMHIDMRKDWGSTMKLAVAGVLVLTLLNSVRIAILIWVGYSSGPDAFWGIHNWVGYALFLGFYMVALVVYTRMGGVHLERRRITQGSLPTVRPS